MKKLPVILPLLALILFSVGCATSRINDYATATTRPIVAPMNDSLEGYNRTIDVVDEQLKRRVMTPIACVWDFLLPKVVRDSVDHFVTNLGYPLNLLSHLLGGQFGYAWRDTQRFGINTTVGVLGLMDPATTKYGLYEIKGGFGRTFSKWGIGQGPYLELPILGGASTREHVGTLFDAVLNPLGYFIPQEASLAITGVKGVNYYSIMEPTLSQLYLTNEYHYEKMRLFMHYAEALYDKEYHFDENSPDWDADDSLGYMAFAPHNPMILHRGRTCTLKINGFGKINYSRWLVKNSRKLVIILPGLGSHRQDNSVLAFAERLNREGVSVAALSSTFTPDFFKQLDSDRPAGYLPDDAKVLAQILPAI
ncbi:MAG: VacJ family lipoprotein, partial [Victivallales bacterium]|nr:VacJ family lipoprotein [Victivallales bacterium]